MHTSSNDCHNLLYVAGLLGSCGQGTMPADGPFTRSLHMAHDTLVLHRFHPGSWAAVYTCSCSTSVEQPAAGYGLVVCRSLGLLVEAEPWLAKLKETTRVPQAANILRTAPACRSHLHVSQLLLQGGLQGVHCTAKDPLKCLVCCCILAVELCFPFSPCSRCILAETHQYGSALPGGLLLAFYRRDSSEDCSSAANVGVWIGCASCGKQDSNNLILHPTGTDQMFP